MDATGQRRQQRVKKMAQLLVLSTVSKLISRTQYGVHRKPASNEMGNPELYNPTTCQILILFLLSVYLTKAKFVDSVDVE